MWQRISWVLALVVAVTSASGQDSLTPRVEVEEEVYRFEPANNGAGPMWCSGSTSLVRVQDQLFASGLETLTRFRPLNNCRWMLFERGDSAWKRVQADPAGRTREPSPLAGFANGDVWLSANPTLTPPEQTAGPARPELYRWNRAHAETPPEIILPGWRDQPQFTEHSYRSLAADGPNNELILFQNIGYDLAEWAFRAADGTWPAQGQLKWPWGAEYDQPQPIRICYPNVMLRNRAVHFCGVSDIVEPYARWREHKRQLTGAEWDYDFRRLFYTWTDDITQQPFADWVEIASRDKTCGWISPCDLHVAEDGRVHILWSERALDPRLRDSFYPEATQSHALNYAVVERGKVIRRQSLVLAEEGRANEIAGAARFQVAPGNRLFVFYYVSGSDAQGQALSENRVLELLPGDMPGNMPRPAVRVPLQTPFVAFFTASVRGGSPPSHFIDLLGMQAGQSNTISYARVRLW
jgi:hypothetical protein